MKVSVPLILKREDLAEHMLIRCIGQAGYNSLLQSRCTLTKTMQSATLQQD